MVELIDTHCHLTYDGLREQVPTVLDRAAAEGVTECVTIATDLADAERALALSAVHPQVHVAAGIHPHQAGKVLPGWDEALAEIVRRDDVRAVGEMGLDFHYDFSDRASQERVFRQSLELATNVSKPVIIHCREAHSSVMAVLADHPRLNGVVFHCFSGSEAEASEILERGYWISWTGVVTFKKSDELRKIAREMPLDRMMLETDSPYLSPEPVRSQRPNEPALMRHTATCVAKARDMSLEELAAATTNNARQFFGLK